MIMKTPLYNFTIFKLYLNNIIMIEPSFKTDYPFPSS